MERQQDIEPEPEQNHYQLNLVEKYLQISDFLEYILDNPDIFLEEKFENIATKAEERLVLLDFLKGFLLKV